MAAMCRPLYANPTWFTQPQRPTQACASNGRHDEMKRLQFTVLPFRREPLQDAYANGFACPRFDLCRYLFNKLDRTFNETLYSCPGQNLHEFSRAINLCIRMALLVCERLVCERFTHWRSLNRISPYLVRYLPGISGI